MNALVSESGQLPRDGVSVAQTPKEIEALRDFWQAKAWHPRMDLDVFLSQCQGTPTSCPYVLRVFRNGALTGILAGRLEETPFEVKLGYWSCWKPKLHALTIPYAGVLGDFSLPNAQTACRQLLAILRRGEAEAVLLDWVPINSDLFKVARSMPIVCWRNAFFRSNPHWKINLPRQADEIWNHSHHRRAWVRRIFKRIETDFPGKVNYRFFKDPGEVEEMCRDAELVAAKSYQRGLGVGFTDNSDSRERLLRYAQIGILRACMLFVDGTPKAFWIGSVYKQRFFSAYLAHDPGLEKYEIGSLVFIKLLGTLCAEGARQVDLGQGEGFYKQRFADVCEEEACLYMLSPSVRSLLLNAGFNAGEALALSARKTLASLNVLQSLKTKWRRRIIKKSDDE